MIKVIFRDDPMSTEAHDEFEDADYTAAKQSFRLACKHWAEVKMVLQNDNDPKDTILLHEWILPDPEDIAKELVKVQPMTKFPGYD